MTLLIYERNLAYMIPTCLNESILKQKDSRPLS